MAVAPIVYSKQAEDADRGVPRPRQRRFVGYGLAALSIEPSWTVADPSVGMPFESSRFELLSDLPDLSFAIWEPKSGTLVEPMSGFLPGVPTGEGLVSVSPIQGDYVILYTKPDESITWHGGEEINFDWAFEPTAGDLDHLPLEIEQRLRELATLKSNWDSYGASAVVQLALEKTRRLLARLYALDLLHVPSPFIAPDPDGGLGLEWDFGPRGEIYLEVSSKGQITYVLTMGEVSRKQQHTLTDDFRGIEQIFKIMQP